MSALQEADLAGLRVAWVRTMRHAYRGAPDALAGSLRALVALRQMPDEARIELAIAMLPAGWSVKKSPKKRSPRRDRELDGFMQLVSATRGPG